MSEKNQYPDQTGAAYTLGERFNRPVASAQATRPLDDLVAQITPENVHKEQPSEEPTPQAERPNEQIWASIIRVAESRREHGECRLSKRACQKLLSERLRAVAPVETRLTAEQFRKQFLNDGSAISGRYLDSMLEAFRDKSESSEVEHWKSAAEQFEALFEDSAKTVAGLREEIERLRGELLIHGDLKQYRFRGMTFEELTRKLFRLVDAEAEVAALRERERWIPVEEKLPEDNGEYTAYSTPNGVVVSRWWAEDKVWRYPQVTHWKALSAAPERPMEGK